MVQQGDAKTGVGAVGDQRPRVVAGAADQQVRRRRQDFEEHPAPTHRFDPRRPLRQAAACPLAHQPVQLEVHTCRCRFSLLGHQDLARGGGVAIERRRQDERRVACEQPAHPAGDGCQRAFGGGLDEDVDVAVAAQAQAPDHVLVAGFVVAQPGGAGVEDHAGDFAHVGFQAAAADAAQGVARLFDQELGAGAPVSRAGDVHHRRQRGATARGFHGGKPRQDLSCLFPMNHPPPPGGPPERSACFATETIPPAGTGFKMPGGGAERPDQL